MKKNRIFAILNWKKDRKENVENEILSKLFANKEKVVDSKFLVFYKESDYPKDKPSYSFSNIELIPMSDEDGKNRAAGLNFVVKHLKENFKDAVAYTIYDSMQLKKDPFDFFDALETMIEKLDIDVWFSTYTDPCNFIFNRFDGRVSVAINESSLKQIYNKTIIWTSHSNPSVMALDLNKLHTSNDAFPMFDDKFEIPMFWIIKYLCERARDKKGFMNHYPTIAEEIGVFKCGEFPTTQISQETMKKEDAMFSEFKLDHTPNQNVEALMDFIIERLKRNK